VSDAQQPRAEYYHHTAEEIRQFARQSQFQEIGEELFELADRFDRMAAHLERREKRRAGGPPWSMDTSIPADCSRAEALAVVRANRSSDGG
jgi:hypothetical protein